MMMYQLLMTIRQNKVTVKRERRREGGRENGGSMIYSDVRLEGVSERERERERTV